MSHKMDLASTSKKLTGKVAVVTASTDGIGLAIARRLGQDGANVMVSSRRQANVDKAVQELTAEGLVVAGIVCHVGKLEDRARLIQETLTRFGGIDILVSNAATNPAVGPILECTEKAWDKTFDVNLKSSFYLCKEMVPYIKQRGGGSVIFISSIAAYYPTKIMGSSSMRKTNGWTPTENFGVYAVSKTALVGLTKALLPQLSSMNIRVNCVAPGAISTKFLDSIWKFEGAKEVMIDSIPAGVGRFGRPFEVAPIVSFLVSDDASYITGECVFVGGGIHGRL